MLNSLQKLIPQRHPLRLGWHRTKAFVAAARYGFPARNLTVIGITGTDGKTTTVGMTAHILHALGVKVGAASTAFLRIKDVIVPNDTHLTSLSPFRLQELLRRMVREGCTHAVIEMSSHGLVQGRVSYTWPQVSAITNTSMEHLDYHRTMDQYRADKGLIFAMLRSAGAKILNGGDPSYRLYAKIPTVKTLVYNDENADLWATDVQTTVGGSEATLHYRDHEFHLSLHLPGVFNIENAQCAVSCCFALNIPIEQSIAALSTFTGLPGRLERIDEDQPFSVYVDFAVSPQAYYKTLQTLRQIVGEAGRVLVLCSSCGNRMREKRPEIGHVCSELADVVVATEDETYGENPHTVLEEVWAGIDQRKCDAHKIFDRRQAIDFLLRAAKPGDAVAICGMGPFSTMTKLEGRIPWDERAITRDLLRTLGKA